MATQQIVYTRIIVPSSMRSPYWRYFGFPADESNNILTKQKIICKICQTSIAYNKNTSNLRTHLTARHPDSFHEIQQQLKNNSFPTTTTVADEESPIEDNAQITKRRRKQSIAADEDFQASVETEEVEEHDVEDILMMPDAIDDLKYDALTSINRSKSGSLATEKSYLKASFVGGDIKMDLQNNEVIIVPEQSENPSAIMQDYADFAAAATIDEDDGNNEVENDDDDAEIIDDVGEIVGFAEANDAIEYIEPFKKTVKSFANNNNSTTHKKMISDMLITDLIPFDIVCGMGFQQMMTSAGLNVNKRAVQEDVCNLYQTMNDTISKHLHEISQKSAYSLSIEFYNNIANVEICNIYFNYVLAKTDCNTLNSVLYHSMNVKNTNTNFVNILTNFKLPNCAGIITNDTENKLLKEFTKQTNLSVVGCLEAVLTTCLQTIFNIPAVALMIDKLLDLFPADYCLQYAWLKLEYLQAILEQSEHKSEECDELLAELHFLLDYISPLKMPLETIAVEQLAACSLVYPLIHKLYQEHFSALNSEIAYLTEVKHIIETQLTKSILQNDYLREATFCDVRFERDFNSDNNDSTNKNQQQLQQEICQRYAHIIEVKPLIKPNIKMERDIKASLSAAYASDKRRASLKSFFSTTLNSSSKRLQYSLIDEPLTQQQQQRWHSKTNIELEFDKYKCEPTLDLEQCPISWWQANKYNYKQLQKIAAYYLCMPCCVNRLYCYDANERMTWLNKRYILCQQNVNVEKYLWYLHYNKQFYDNLIGTL